MTGPVSVSVSVNGAKRQWRQMEATYLQEHFTIHIIHINPDVAGRGDATELLGAQQSAAHRRKLSELRVVHEAPE